MTTQVNEVVTYSIVDQVGVIKLNFPPVNALSFVLRTGIVQALEIAQNDDSKAIIIICEGRTFIAGADITEFNKPPQHPILPELLEEHINVSNKLIVAAIHGTALGGGLETALCCHYRIALESAKVGLPEVKLGILPGAGGTQRVPRISGVLPALEFITKGNPMPANQALSINLLDKVIPADSELQAEAVQYCHELLDNAAPLRRISDMSVDPETAPAALFEQVRSMAAKQAKGMIAPLKIIDCIEASVTTNFTEGLQIERDKFIECIMSPQSAALRHLFFAERQVAKIKGIDSSVKPRDIKRVGIIGAGLMGGGIAMNFINVGIPVTILDVNEEGLAKGLSVIEGNYKRSVKKGKLTEDKFNQRMSLLNGTTDYSALADVDLVIEAVFENLELKKKVFAELDDVCKPDAILASNTSYQNIDEIAAATNRPDKVCGMHFFSPANVMKLLEVVRASQASSETIVTAMAIGKAIKKVTVLAGVCYGFIGNRMFNCYMREAQLCLLEGASPQQIDSTLENWGMAMGSLAVGDLAGLDVGYKARESLPETEKAKLDPKVTAITNRLVEQGDIGQKSGKGIYCYDAETRARLENKDLNAIIEEEAANYNIIRRNFTDEEILDRHILALVNEGAYILEEGIAQRPSDIDITYIYGYGFAPAQGGPMHYADTLGMKTVYQRICEFQEQFGDAWKPAPLIQKLAEGNKSFQQWAKEG